MLQKEIWGGHRASVVPGHEVVGQVVARGAGASRFAEGERIGIAWLRSTCGSCQACRAGRENLCPHSQYTGWDADGGYAEYTVVPQSFAYRIPERYDDEAAAPLLCAGIIGYRALRRAAVPPGGRLGIYGFGGSAHITAQIAIAQGIEIHVLTAASRPGNWPSSWERRRRERHTTHRRCHSTRRSSSRP